MATHAQAKVRSDFPGVPDSLPAHAKYRGHREYGRAVDDRAAHRFDANPNTQAVSQPHSYINLFAGLASLYN